MEKRAAFLVLADGTVFEGRRFGAEGPAEGELVFTTAMTGYQETLTDPSYVGQIVCQTFPAIGNYGVNAFDNESARVWPAAYVVREWCEQPSNFRCEETVDTFLKNHKVPGIYHIDTRALTRRLRKQGTVNAALLPQMPEDLPALLGHLKGIRPLSGAVRRVSRKTVDAYPAQGGRKHKVALYDFGVKEAIIRRLTERGCEVVAVPCDLTAEELGAIEPDGILFSSGPGDPVDCPELSDNLREVVNFGKPMFGICLGHQLLARALGAGTEKLPFGHRGENQPVKDIETGRTYITSQSHGYAVLESSLKQGKVSHINANDGSVEGIIYPELGSFSVQFHPEASAGPEDTRFLFDRFIALL